MMSSPPPPSSTKGGGVGGAVGVPGSNTSKVYQFSPFVPKMTFSTANMTEDGGTADFGSLLANSSTLLSSMAQSTRTTSMTTNSSPFLLGGVTRIASGGGGEGRRDTMRNPTTSYAEESAAHRLLSQVGQGGFNASDLGRRVRDLERRSFSGNNVPTTSFGGREKEEEKKDNLMTSNYNNNIYNNSNSHNNDGSINSILASHHEYCINSAIRKSRESSNRLSARRVEERLKKDWLERRERCVSSILGRDNRYATGGNSSSSGMMTGGVGGGHVAARVPLLLDGDNYHTATTSSSLSSVSIVPSPQRMPPGIENIIKYHQTAIDGYIVRNRSIIIPTTTTTATTNNVTNTTIFNAISVLNSLEDGTKDSINGSNEAMNGYVNALSLIRSIINCRVSLPTSSSSSLASSSTLDVHTNVALDVVGACQHLANQFTFHIQEIIRENELGGYSVINNNSNINNSTKARDICAYATIVVGRDVAEGRGGVWPKLFYCECLFCFEL